MTITLQMPPALEASLRDQAAREGVDASTLVLRALEQQFGSAACSSPAAREAELLLRINDGPPETVWRRYHELSAKRDAETLTPEEHGELIGLSEVIEAADVRRLEYMAELASLRGVALRAVRTQLGSADSDLKTRQVAGCSNTGRATVAKLKLNRPEPVKLRRIVRLAGQHPPT